jgi:uncharacterized protein (TIGR03118 family)
MRRLIPFVAAVFGLASPAAADHFVTTNLVTDNQGANPAQVTDPNLVNAWGISFSPNSSFWVSANGKGLASLYRVDPLTNATTTQGLVVSIQGAGNVTGQVFNGTPAFHANLFLFVSEDGTVSGWRGALGTQAEILQSPSTDNNYKGTTLVTNGTNTYLLSANFHSGAVDVLKGAQGNPNLAGNFTDPGLPSGYAPFNIQLLGDKVYVAYAKQGSGGDEQSGAGLGIVSEFDTQGNFIRRVGSSGGTLNAPWGLAIAPSSFGFFAGDLLVGNSGDGTINAFNLNTNTFAGQLLGSDGNPLHIDGLWGLTPGNGVNAGSADTIYYTAGPGDGSHGLLGAISSGPGSPTSVPEPSSVILGLIGIGTLTARRRFMRLGGTHN